MKGLRLQINARFENPIIISIWKPYNKMRSPFLEQRRGIQRKTKVLIDKTLLNPRLNKQKSKGSSTSNNARIKNPTLIGIQKPYNKMRIPFLEQRNPKEN